MTKSEAMHGATREAKRHNVKIVVVHAPIELHDECDGDIAEAYGWCPAHAKDLLFPCGSVVQMVTPKHVEHDRHDREEEYECSE